MAAEIAFIVAAVRVDRLLRDAVESIRETSHTPVELCVVLDGHREEVPEWLKAAGTIISLRSRSGPAAARNAGFAATSAPLVAVMDADDLALPGRADRPIEHLARQPDTDLVGGSCLRIDDGGRVRNRAPAYSGKNLPRDLVRRNLFVHSTVTFRRRAIETYGGYDTRCLQMEDYELILRWASRGARIATVHDYIAGYRVHSRQMSRQRLGYPYSFYAIHRNRLELAKRVGLSVGYAEALHWSWVTWQWTYSLGLRDLGFDRVRREGPGYSR